ncbi:retinol-binding protein pinta isoform X2 [Orussus abietinus]|uniref:retinol-binding protein pinta isoform X2 n=1 Tax=Orussus abietinus TaxID=222816 RepID=UPI000C715BE2|nr:retinol-binding protein pinta isoform X2 [Orussus abietinus]
MALIKSPTLEEEMRKNPELKESDIQALREWCAKQPHLPKISDFELALFLHSNYYRLEPTKNTIDVFYTIRSHVPELFSNRDPLGSKAMRQALNVGCFLPLKKTTEEGYKIVLAKLVDFDPSHYVYNDCTKYFCMVLDMWLYTEGTAKGHVLLIDIEGVTLGHAGRLSPMGLKKFLYYLQDGLPVRLKAPHALDYRKLDQVYTSGSSAERARWKSWSSCRIECCSGKNSGRSPSLVPGRRSFGQGQRVSSTWQGQKRHRPLRGRGKLQEAGNRLRAFPSICGKR